MDVNGFLGRSLASFRRWVVGAGEVCAFIREVDTQTHWRERESKAKDIKSYRIPDGGWVM